MDRWLEQKARNEALIREVNERVAELNKPAEEANYRPEESLFEFFCECGGTGEKGAVLGCERGSGAVRRRRPTRCPFALNRGISEIVSSSRRMGRPIVEDGSDGALLNCVECGAESDQLATGWRAYVAPEREDEPEGELVTFCPDCAEREFGPSGWDAPH